MRLVTRSDFDGLVCAMILKEIKLVDEIKFVHPKDVQDGKIVAEQVLNTDGSGHCALAGFLQAAKVDALICGGIGMGAQLALADAGIRLYAGVQGSADAAAKALAEETLVYDPNARCEHHDHHEDGCGHHEHHGECSHGKCEDYHCHNA